MNRPINHRAIAARDLGSRAEGLANLANVRAYFAAHMCATQRECADALGLSIMAVHRHVKTIRNEWRK